MADAQPLTPQELAIMKVVWRLRTATVREVHDVLRRERRDDLAYTTVLTMMRILEQKGVLSKTLDPDSRAHRYRPVRTQSQVMRLMVREFVDRVFDGAAEPLVAHLVSDRRLSARDRAEIRRLLDEKDEKED
jgi:BlaI family transcriptional regulator, penicillinase repressor